ncbi:ASCH domain-containing protein [Streptosporangium roseum]|uniref:ASCH domain-containing protein n=1 Tax=Streptosporangium roseum TaxID=2001 RepID=UPI00068947C9|nr:ASCH domain-containing protein [Streptosporangium roseum]
MAEQLPALTIRQPWAWAITHGTKRIENRTWTTQHRGPLAIHAGTRIDRGALDDMRIRGTAHNLGQARPDYELGAVIAVAQLVHIHSCTRGLCSIWSAHGQHHWELTDIRPLAEPVPCKGRLGLWPLPADADAAVRAQLAAQDACA